MSKKYKKSFLLWFSDHGANGIRYTFNKYDQDLKCDECHKIGSWFILNEKYKIGMCSKCLGVGMTFSFNHCYYKLTIAENENLDRINPENYNDLKVIEL